MGNKKVIVSAAILLCIALVAGWLFTRYYNLPARQADNPLIEMKEAIPGSHEQGMGAEDMVVIRISYPSKDGIVTGEKVVQKKLLPVLMAETVLAEYLSGLKGGLEETKLLGVYRDSNNIFYIDLSDEFRRNFSGDVMQEFYLLKSLFDTVITNIAGTVDVRLLIEGREIESIGGHLYVLYGLKETVAD